MNWNDLAKEVHRDAVDKGEWDKPRTLDDVICDCLVHLSNAYTAWKDGRPNYYHLCQPSGEKEHICDLDCGGTCSIAHGDLCEYRGNKPQGVAVELADCVLRLLDYLATTDVDLSNMYPVKIMADGPFTSFVTDIVINLISARIGQGNDKAENGCGSLRFLIERILGFAAVNNIDLESILREKHECNKTRRATCKRIATDGPEQGRAKAGLPATDQAESEGSGSGHAPNGRVTSPNRHGREKL